MSNYKNNIELRENVIGYIYSQELLGTTLSSDQAFETGEYNEKEIKYIDAISKSYDVFKKMISKFIKKGWTWTRISPLNRAVLLYGTFELSFNDKALVIDVMLKYTKEFMPDESYKFVNPILDKIGELYETIKNNKK